MNKKQLHARNARWEATNERPPRNVEDDRKGRAESKTDKELQGSHE